MNHHWKEEKYLIVDTSKEIDVFYPDLNDGKIQWVHYDTTQSLVEICVFNISWCSARGKVNRSTRTF